jgi:hypothetical protein
MEQRTTVNRTMVVRNPERDARIVKLARDGVKPADIAARLEMTFQNVRYVLLREGLWDEPDYLDRVAHLALSGHGTEAIARQTGLTVGQVRAALWLASGEWQRLRTARE